MNIEPAESYHSLGVQRARDTLGAPASLDEPGLKKWINTQVKGDTLMYATSVDWWLGLKKGVGAVRRGQNPPPNPFKPRGEGGKSADQATRSDVEAWHRGWIQRLGVQAQHDALQGKEDQISDSMLNELRGENPWLVQGKSGRIVGFANASPSQLIDQAFADPQDLQIEWHTLDSALRRQWFDREERSTWIRILRHTQLAAIEQRRARFESKIADQSAAVEPSKRDAWIQSRRHSSAVALETLQARLDHQYAELRRLALSDFVSR